MIANRLIDRSIPFLKTTDTVQSAKELMNHLKVNQLPVVSEEMYLGILTEDVLLNLPVEETAIAALPLLYADIVISDNYHFYEILKTVLDTELDIVAVTDAQHKYLGVVTLKEAAFIFSNKFAVHPSSGGIIIFSIKGINYSMAEISRLIESNEAKILSSFIELDPEDNSNLLVTVQLNTLDLTRILATFERFEYDVLGHFQDPETQEVETFRIDLLLKYLEL